MIDYVKLSILIGTFIAGTIVGYYPVHVAYSNYKLEVQNATKAQEAHVASIEKQHKLVTDSIEKEYDAKITAIRNYYKSTSVWNNSSSSKVSRISPAPSASDVIAAYNQLAGLCAETTAQTIALQDWIKAQAGIK